MLELVYVYPLYVTIGGSLNILQGNNPAFLEGHFVRVELLEVIIMPAWLPQLCACNLYCYIAGPRISMSPSSIEILGKQNSLFPSGPVTKCLVFDTSVFCQLFLSRFIHSSGGTKFGIFREHVDYWHLVLLRRGRSRLFD